MRGTGESDTGIINVQEFHSILKLRESLILRTSPMTSVLPPAWDRTAGKIAKAHVVIWDS